jgi:hypothetical protein
LPAFELVEDLLEQVAPRPGRSTLSPPLLARRALVEPLLDRLSMSARISSNADRLDVAQAGFTSPSTWMTSASSKQRTTWTIASVGADVAEELVAEPLALAGALARGRRCRRTRPRWGRCLLGLDDLDQRSRRGSGTATTPTFGSIVQKG